MQLLADRTLLIHSLKINIGSEGQSCILDTEPTCSHCQLQLKGCLDEANLPQEDAVQLVAQIIYSGKSTSMPRSALVHMAGEKSLKIPILTPRKAFFL